MLCSSPSACSTSCMSTHARTHGCKAKRLRFEVEDCFQCSTSLKIRLLSPGAGASASSFPFVLPFAYPVQGHEAEQQRRSTDASASPAQQSISELLNFSFTSIVRQGAPPSAPLSVSSGREVAIGACVVRESIDGEASIFKPEQRLHLNGQPLQYLALLSQVRAEVAQALRRRISRRVTAGTLSKQAGDFLTAQCMTRLAMPVSLALQRYCAAKRFFTEGQPCLSREVALVVGTGALGLWSKDVSVIATSLVNAILKAATQADEEEQLEPAASAVSPPADILSDQPADQDTAERTLQAEEAEGRCPRSTESFSFPVPSPLQLGTQVPEPGRTTAGDDFSFYIPRSRQRPAATPAAWPATLLAAVDDEDNDMQAGGAASSSGTTGPLHAALGSGPACRGQACSQPEGERPGQVEACQRESAPQQGILLRGQLPAAEELPPQCETGCTFGPSAPSAPSSKEKAALAAAFMAGLGTVDWFAAVQEAYGFDSEELLEQQESVLIMGLGHAADSGSDVVSRKRSAPAGGRRPGLWR